MSSRLTSMDIDNAVLRYQAGETQKQIAESFGVTQASVSRWLSKRGVTGDRSAIGRRVYERKSPAERAQFHEAAKDHETTPWTDNEIGFLLDHPDMSSHLIGKELGRPPASAQRMRRKLSDGWSPTQRRFTEYEDQVILDNPTWSASRIAQALNGRTVDSVMHRRNNLRAKGHIVSTSHGNSSPFRPGGRPIIAKTCPDCGLLLQAHWFTVVSGAWRRNCNRCNGKARIPSKKDQAKHLEVSRKSYAKYQQMTVARATNNGNPWMESDMATLSDPDLTLFQKSLILRRTYASVGQAAKKHGFKSKIGLGDPERDQWMIDNPNLASDGTLLVTVPSIPEAVSPEQLQPEPMWA